ncbi:MAG TPA: heterodisulfide reductase-related iron-sulfur binding cluster [Anaeromyxobacteraceae bacterium]|nr:heterodisulfide reductase-related iron-sulfur binding cluster [Anaeromyxobacteraceae bacterium]
MPDRHPVDDCVHCGFCLPACPTYLAWGEEMDSPRGRVDLVRALRDGTLQPTAEVGRHLDRCLGCMACLPACPSGVRYDRIIEEARAILERTVPRALAQRAKRRLIFSLFPYPARLRVVAFLLWLLRVTGLARLLRALGLVRVVPFLRQMDGLAPELTWREVTASLAPVTPASGERRGRVALVSGCVQRVFFPAVNEATLRILAAEGFEVLVPTDQGCCGALSVHAGREEEARRLTKALVERLEATGADFILVNAAGCGSHLKDLSLLFRDDPTWRERAASFSRRVKDVTEFLAAQPARSTRHPLGARVAYHSPCHLGHAQGVQEPPRALLRAIPGLELVEVPESDHCCGSAGIYNLVEVEAANEIGARKTGNILATGASYLASANPGCTLHVQRLLREKGIELPAAHPLEILDASIRGAPLPRRGH